MSRQNQIDLLKRLLHYVDTRTTALAERPWHNDVSVYTDAGRLAEEQRDGLCFGMVHTRQLPYR